MVLESLKNSKFEAISQQAMTSIRGGESTTTQSDDSGWIVATSSGTEYLPGTYLADEIIEDENGTTTVRVKKFDGTWD